MYPGLTALIRICRGANSKASALTKYETPANSAYHDLVAAYAAGGFSGFTTTAEQIAALIWRALSAKHPKTRYQPNRAMTMLVIAARKLSYKRFDKMMFKQLQSLMRR